MSNFIFLRVFASFPIKIGAQNALLRYLAGGGLRLRHTCTHETKGEKETTKTWTPDVELVATFGFRHTSWRVS